MDSIHCACGQGFTVGRPGVDWPEPCPVCKGATVIPIRKIARACGVDAKTIHRLDEMRTRAGTALQVLPKLLAIIDLGDSVARHVAAKRPIVLTSAQKRTVQMFDGAEAS